MNITLSGPLLGLKSIASNRDGHAFWSNIQISLACNDEEHLYSLPNIGYNPESYGDLISFCCELNAPLRLKIPIHCEKEKISQIKLNFDHIRRHGYMDINKVPSERKEIIWKVF